jgi:uncharacterized protein
MTEPNPFRTSGVVRPPYFTNRDAEIRAIRRALADPGGKLIVVGERRMGKTSALAVALDRHRRARGMGFMADLSTASSPADLANRVLTAAVQELSRRWKNRVQELLASLSPGVTLGTDARGLPTATLSLDLRQRSESDQYDSLVGVLDALEEVARRNGRTLAVVLDEFQEIHAFGGETAEWRLRGAVQHHQHLSYVFAGSRPALIARMQEKNRAFYKLAERLHFGPIDPEHLAGWIDERMSGAGVEPAGAGKQVVRIGGPRTWDVVRLARRTFEMARPSGAADEAVVRAAFTELAGEEDDTFRLYWKRLTGPQQNVLRALAAGAEELQGQAARRRFALPSSQAVIKALRRFEEDGVIVPREEGGHAFDSPYVRGWVVLRALPDIGITLSPIAEA